MLYGLQATLFLAAGLIIGGEVVKDLINKHQPMRIEPQDAPNNPHAMQAHERAVKMLEQYKAMTNEKKDDLSPDCLHLRDMIRNQN